MRGYSDKIIESPLLRAKSIPRKVALLRVFRKKSLDRPVFAITYDPRLPSISSAQAKHWRAMVSQDSYLAEVFPQPPLTAFKRQKNLRDFLVRAKVPKIQTQHSNRRLNGMKKCGQNCTACPYIQEGKKVKIGTKDWNINSKVNCRSYNVVYLLVCKKDNCKEKFYIGETKNMLKFRIDQHRGFVNNEKLDTASGAHFNLPGHSLSDLSVTILEKVKKNDISYQKERERYHINKFNTYYKGINRQP